MCLSIALLLFSFVIALFRVYFILGLFSLSYIWRLFPTHERMVGCCVLRCIVRRVRFYCFDSYHFGNSMFPTHVCANASICIVCVFVSSVVCIEYVSAALMRAIRSCIRVCGLMFMFWNIFFLFVSILPHQVFGVVSMSLFCCACLLLPLEAGFLACVVVG